MLILLLFIGTARALTLALTDNISDKYTFSNHGSSFDFMFTVLKGAALGKEFHIEEDEFNDYINRKYTSPAASDGSGVDKVHILFNKAEPSQIYAHAFIHSTGIAIKANAEFSLDSSTSRFSITLSDAWVGELKIPDFILSAVLRSVLSENKDITVSGTTISAHASYNIEISESSLNVRLMELTVGNQEISCRTNSLAGEALRALTEYLLSKEGGEHIKNLWDKIRN